MTAGLDPTAMPSLERNIEISIGLLCNNACPFCANGERPSKNSTWVPAESVIEEMTRAAEQGIRSVSFLGGEVTIYPACEVVVRAARRLGFTRVALCTNGRRLADRQLLECLVDAGVTRIALSIHSHEQVVEDRLNGRRGAWNQKIAAIENLADFMSAHRLADGFSLNCCVHGLNSTKLVELVQFFHDRRVRDVRLNSLRPAHDAIGNRELVPTFGNCIPEALRLVLLNESSLHMTVTFGDFPLCVWPPQFLRNSAISRRYLGELRDLDTAVTLFKGPSDAKTADRFRWRERRASALKRQVKACQDCPAQFVCEGVWTGYLDIYGEREFHPLPELVDTTALSVKELSVQPQAWVNEQADSSFRHRLFIVASDRCNNSCGFCQERQSAQAASSVAAARRAMEQFSSREVVVFGGREPTMADHLLQLVAHASALGYRRIEIATNGRRLAYASYCDSLIRAGANGVTIAIHGACSETHDALSGVVGSFDQSVSGLKNLVQLRERHRGIRISVRTILNERNLGSLDALAATVAELGISHWIVEYVEAKLCNQPHALQASDAAAAVGCVRLPVGLAIRVLGLPPRTSAVP